MDLTELFIELNVSVFVSVPNRIRNQNNQKKVSITPYQFSVEVFRINLHPHVYIFLQKNICITSFVHAPKKKKDKINWEKNWETRQIFMYITYIYLSLSPISYLSSTKDKEKIQRRWP